MPVSTQVLGPPVARREWLVIAAIVLVGGLARVWDVGGVSLNHYDEGVYAFSAWGLADGDRPLHPEQRNSPIALSWLASLAMRVLGPTDLAPIGVSLAIGTLTIPLLWLVTRRWFGAASGAVAATLLACNEFHIAMSRSGMTDVVFTFTFVLALPWVGPALSARTWRPAIVAGLLTGVAWNAKYHGWLATAIGTAGWLPYAWLTGAARTQYLAALPRLALMTVVAFACYLPWFFKAAELAGGFAALAAYQTTFLSSHWPTNFARQATNLWYFEGALSRAAVPAALSVAACLVPGVARGRWLAALALSIVAGLVAGGTISLWVLTVAAIPLLMRRRDLGAWTVLAWGAALIVLAPMYRPYARTVLPLMTATCVAAAVVLVEWTKGGNAADERQGAATGWMPAAAAAAAAAMLAFGIWSGDTARWRRSRDLPEAARQIRAIVGEGAKVIVIGEAALAFYLETEGVRAFKGFEYWETVVAEREPVHVVTGIYNQLAPTLRENYARLKDRLTPIADYRFMPYDHRLLESFPPQDVLAFLRDGNDKYRLRLFRYTPDPSGRVPELVR